MNSGHAAPGWTYAVAEHHIYGSSRVGVHNTNKLIASRDNQNPIVYTSTNTEYTTFTRGKRHYELSNHLGNVQVVISDKRVSVCDEYLGVDRFEAEVLSAMDYYPFGMLSKTNHSNYEKMVLRNPDRSDSEVSGMIPDRQWYANSDSSNYRFGFNGKERDNEISGKGNSIDFGARIYDSRLGKFFSIDPIIRYSPRLSGYIFASNQPISKIDYYGLFSMSPEDISKYPELASMLKNIYEFLQHEPKMRKAFFEATNVSEELFENNFTWGKGPRITVERFKDKGIKGKTEKSLNLITINETFFDNLRSRSTLKDFEMDIFMLLKTVMHEASHASNMTGKDANLWDIIKVFLFDDYRTYMKNDVGFQFERLFVGDDQYSVKEVEFTDGFLQNYKKYHTRGVNLSGIFQIEHLNKYEHTPEEEAPIPDQEDWVPDTYDEHV